MEVDYKITVVEDSFGPMRWGVGYKGDKRSHFSDEKSSSVEKEV